jgi:hypothetical protein
VIRHPVRARIEPRGAHWAPLVMCGVTLVTVDTPNGAGLELPLCLRLARTQGTQDQQQDYSQHCIEQGDCARGPVDRT